AGSFASDSQKARFEREAALVASINHPNIVAVHTFGNVRGQRYFTMDLIDGKSLDRRIAEKSITPHQAAEIASIICRAVHHAHDAGVVHRDLKPANILLDKSEKPYITDFGLAKAEDASKSLTESGVAIGTPHYMSPEQASGDVSLIDRRSDVYSIGVILYEMLCGRVPFEGTRAVEILMKIVQEEAPPPSSIKAGIPRDLEAICVKAMSYEPSKRYQSAEQMALDLESYLQGGSVSARPPTNLDRAVRMLRKYRISIAMFLVLTSSVAVAIYSMDVLGRGTGEEAKIIGQLQDAEEKVGQGDLVSARAALSAARGMPESSSVTDRASRLRSTVKAKLLADFAREKDLERTAAIVAELRRFLPGDDATVIEKVGEFTGRLQIATDTTYSERGPSAAGSLFSSIALALNEQSTVIEPIRKYLSNKLSSDTAGFEKTSDTIDKAIECLQVLAMLNPSDDTYAKRIAKLRSAQANVLMEILEQALNLFGFGSVSVSGEHQGCEVEIEALSGSLKGTRQTFDLRLQQSFKLQNGLYLFRFKREGYIDIERRIPVVRDRDSAIEIRGADWVAKQ
ncbi:MAG: serine/threonine-protein kinase, partial [Candidatus Brocadiia bacterium]